MPHGHTAKRSRRFVGLTRDRWRELAERLEGLLSSGSSADAICALAAECLGSSSVSLTLCLGGTFSPLAATGAVARSLDERQFALGEGPSWDAAATSLPVFAADLVAPGPGQPVPEERWPSFCRSAEDDHVQAAFAFPLQVGLLTVAVLTAYRDHASPLSTDEYVDGLTVAAIGTTALFAEQSGEASGRLAEVFRIGVHDRSRLQRAAGMVAERDGTTIVEAMVRIRAHAYATDRSPGDVARDICERRLVLPVKEEQ